MPRPKAKDSDWIDGFLFLGNHLALNFLNTKPVLEDGPRELLQDGEAFGRWLAAAGVVSKARGRAVVTSLGGTAKAQRFVKQLRAFRERFRGAVLRIESGRLPAKSFVNEVNELLAKYPRRTILVSERGSLVRDFSFELEGPDYFWALIIEAVAALLTKSDHERMRKCPSCVVHFLDTSKKGSRRWCSMNICGNKVKVARYQGRRSATYQGR